MHVRLPEEDGHTTGLLRRMVLGVFLLGAVGTGAELVLLGHYEQVWQTIPLGLLALSLAVLALWCIVGGDRILRVFQRVMLLCVGAGILGVYLHYQSNVEFELEVNPSARGINLIWESLTGAMPALAPGALLHLGLIGLLYAYKHPVFRRA